MIKCDNSFLLNEKRVPLRHISQKENSIKQVYKMTFARLGINDNIVQALDGNKILKPTDIQIQAIPHILKHNKDLVAVAQTGTGKTAAFCLPILQTIDPKLPKIQALVLVPTRELGQQVAREFFLFSKFLPRVFAEAVYGGVPPHWLTGDGPKLSWLPKGPPAWEMLFKPKGPQGPAQSNVAPGECLPPTLTP